MKEDWGPYTWNMFHTLSQKIKEEQFLSIKRELWNLFKKVSCNLPCPYCSKHACEYLSKIKVQDIHTKEDFINIFFEFHNDVNKRLNKPLFDKEKLIIYDSFNTIQTLNIFMYMYKVSSGRTTAFHKALLSNHTLSEYQNWMIQNLDKFEK